MNWRASSFRLLEHFLASAIARIVGLRLGVIRVRLGEMPTRLIAKLAHGLNRA